MQMVQDLVMPFIRERIEIPSFNILSQQNLYNEI